VAGKRNINLKSKPNGDKSTRVLLCGDTILTRNLDLGERSPLARVRTLMESVDVRFTNLEAPFNGWAGSPNANEIIHLSTSPEMATILTEFGFNLCSAANNHALDYGVEGLTRSMRALKAAKLLFAGIGRDLWEASRPVYVDVSGSRVALIASTSTMESGWQAADRGHGVDARPGVNPLRYTQHFTLARRHFNSLVSLSRALSWDKIEKWHVWMGHRAPVSDRKSELRFLDHVFHAGSSNQVSSEAHSADFERILTRTREAAQLADYVIISIHSHEFQDDLEKPAKFLVDVARKCIKAGAHVVAVSGPHLLRGAELFESGIIFYSLGNFFFQYETMERVPGEGYVNTGLDPSKSHIAEFMDKAIPGLRTDLRYWESVVPVCVLCDGRLTKVEVYPIEISNQSCRGKRGTPRFATKGRDQTILNRFNQLCRPFGTRFEFRDGIGILKIEGP
jgi:poly-gamma-glutamate capsule biosynthesis protein CapA/YwtB (metallophosphatase superfamily)